ncbi:hypothetical protein F5887DRAFT_1138928 [Amanita rubescens]|nr:hypothetical protein F5887DRAFT_1138928 [Amanita rubescens]
MRCLVLLENDEEALAIWSRAVLVASVHQPVESWLVLMRKLSLFMLRSIAKAPQSSHALNHLRVLNTLLSPKQFTQPYDTQIPEHLFHNGLYSLISKPAESKSSPALPLLVGLVKSILSVSQPPQTYHPQTVCQVVANLLTIPLLPYRLPLKSLGSFSASMPFSDLNVVSPNLTPIVESLDESSRIHLLSNLVSFVPPRYPSLSKEAVSGWAICRPRSTLVIIVIPSWTICRKGGGKCSTCQLRPFRLTVMSHTGAFYTYETQIYADEALAPYRST